MEPPGRAARARGTSRTGTSPTEPAEHRIQAATARPGRRYVSPTGHRRQTDDGAPNGDSAWWDAIDRGEDPTKELKYRDVIDLAVQSRPSSIFWRALVGATRQRPDYGLVRPRGSERRMLDTLQMGNLRSAPRTRAITRCVVGWTDHRERDWLGPCGRVLPSTVRPGRTLGSRPVGEPDRPTSPPRVDWFARCPPGG